MTNFVTSSVILLEVAAWVKYMRTR